MKKIIAYILALSMLMAIMPAISIHYAVNAQGANLLTNDLGTFETDTSASWDYTHLGNAPTISSAKAHSGTYALLQTGRTLTYESPTYNIYDTLKASGAGVYQISMWVYADGMSATSIGYIALRCTPDSYSFFTDAASKFAILGSSSVSNRTWTKLSGTVVITASDLANAAGTMSLCVDAVVAPSLYIDDVSINYLAVSDTAPIGKYKYDYSYVPAFPSTTTWHRIDDLGTDVLNLDRGTATVVIQNTGASAFSAVLNSRDSNWSNEINSTITQIPAGEIRTITISALPPTSTILLIELIDIDANTSFSILNITKIAKANSLNANSADILNTIVSLSEIPPTATATPAPTPAPFYTSDFENGSSGWTNLGSGTLSVSTAIAHSGTKSLGLTSRGTTQWYSPQLNIYNLLKSKGAGVITVNFWVYSTAAGAGRILIRGAAANQYSFFPNNQSYAYLSSGIITAANTWTQYSASFIVSTSDLTLSSGTMNICIDSLTSDSIYFDDFNMYYDKLFIGNTVTYKAYDNATNIALQSVETGSNAIAPAPPTRLGHLEYAFLGWYKDATIINKWDFVSDKVNADTTLYPKFVGLGDVNNSDTVTASDALKALQAASGKIILSADEITVADVNVDSNITSSDALKILQYASGRLTSFAPSPAPISAAQWQATEISFTSAFQDSLIAGDTVQSTFETAIVPTGWSVFGGGAISTTSALAHDGAKSLELAGHANTWYSPCINIYNLLKNGGAGTYDISLWAYINALPTSLSNGQLVIRGQTADINSFLSSAGGASFGSIGVSTTTPANTWIEYKASLKVLDSDITRETGEFNLMLDAIATTTGQNLYIDDLKISKNANADIFNNKSMDVTFTAPDNSTLVRPAFWDGGSSWKVRFAPTMTGDWTYNTTCSDTNDAGLHNKSGKITCAAYTGDLDIYKHGFIKISANKRYFTYADGTPFFYLGDTHCATPYDNFDGSNIPGVASQTKYMVDKRVAQGFTVYQAYELGAKFNLRDGLSNCDIPAFEDIDKKFKYITDMGLVLANSQLFFTTELSDFASSYPDAYLEKLCRYWVARYGAYPVMWTTAQEADDDFYYDQPDQQKVFDATTNPWKKVAAWVHKYDCYSQPLTSHMEYASMDPVHGVNATRSSFKYIDGHNWFAMQWTPARLSQLDFSIPKNFWNCDVTKPTVNYEGSFDHFWTNSLGARLEGWSAYLNGVYGFGYGAAGVWLTINDYATGDYAGNYDLDRDTDSEITMAVKRMNWYEGMQLPAANQLGFMHTFFSAIEWWNLTPRFDDTVWFSNNGSFYSVASKNNDLYVAYFYNTTTNTGTLKGMANVPYWMQWFNPITGVYGTAKTITPANGSYVIGVKPDGNDWVLKVYKK